MPYVGLTGIFPKYWARTGTVVSLQERVNDCFMRSLNGKPLPMDSAEMNGILAYIAWLSWGTPTGMEVEGRGVRKLPPPETPPDPVRGKELFASICSACHGPDGAGQKGGDGFYTIPPLWGGASFNIAAGMARLNTAAAFVKHNMPLGRSGLLDDRDAYDIASYFTAQPRPDFPLKHLDWPKGGKPADARY
ncbi:MAG: c-type cytochrome [Nitrospinae bacterium]|nr:c-type cytochrome [Nitrospinota bacterium]